MLEKTARQCCHSNQLFLMLHALAVTAGSTFTHFTCKPSKMRTEQSSLHHSHSHKLIGQSHIGKPGRQAGPAEVCCQANASKNHLCQIKRVIQPTGDGVPAADSLS